ncbi:MAG: hypothetical protein CMK44_00370 [Porticoccus sp.]|nr:hypothetical protein [Porticoccus sp.]
MNAIKIRSLTENLINIMQLSYVFNGFFVTILYLLLVITGNGQFGIKLVYYGAVTIFITQMFSINARNIGISDRNLSTIFKNITFRLTLSPVLLIFSFLFYLIILKENLTMPLFFTSLLCIQVWIFELCLALIEMKKRSKYLAFYYIFLIIVILFLLFLNDINFNIFLVSIIMFNIIYIIFILSKLNYNFSKFNIEDFYKDKFNFFSSLSLTSANLIIKLILYKFYQFGDLEIIYLCISLFSLPGSLVTTSFGATFFSKNRSLPWTFKMAIRSIFLLMITLTFIYLLPININNINVYKVSIPIDYLIIVLFSSLLQYCGQIIRVIRLSNNNYRIYLFQSDILFSIFSILNLILFIIFLQKIFIIFVLINSLLGIIIYLSFRIHAYYKI